MNKKGARALLILDKVKFKVTTHKGKRKIILFLSKSMESKCIKQKTYRNRNG